ncbi:hypothetical protein HBNXNv_0080 [Candidatus Nanohalovita haloferacivicina]|nr:hypothetical protein HBNXNv_0080 [Candidatus Nanohalobia archaeon BNXNv]
MSEVGSGRPFDVLVRGEYRPETGDVKGFNLGGRSGVFVDMANFDLENHYFRVYNVDFSPSSTDFERAAEFSEGRSISSSIRGLENNWGYELSTIPYDRGAEFEGVEPVQGTVYWPEKEDFIVDEAYEDFVDLLGSDVLSRL